MPNFSSVLRLNKIPVTGIVAESSGTAPASPVFGQLWTDTSVTPKLVRIWDGAIWAPANIYAGTTATSYAAGNDVRLSDQRVPTDGSVTGGTAGAGIKIAASTITIANIAAAHIDGLAATASLRTLGTTAASAAAGNDARLSDTRTPTFGSVVDASVSASAAIAESKLALATDAAAGVGSRRTLSLTSTTAALPGGTTVNALATANAMTAALVMNSQRITGLGAPSAASDAARLQDVQNAQAGIDVKASVRAATTTNAALATAFANGSVVDGITLLTNDRLLIKSQTAADENGLYVVSATGAPTRTTDTITPNTFVFVEEGTTLADTAWMVTNNGTISVGVTAIVWAQFAGGSSVIGTAGRITVTGTQVDIASTYAGQASINTVGTVGTGVWQATAIAISSGGTGSTSAVVARSNLNTPQQGFAANLGAITAGTPLIVTHSLGTQDVIAQVRDASTNEYVYLDIINASISSVSVTSGLSYAAAALRIVILPVA